MNTRTTPPPNNYKKHAGKYSRNNKKQSLQSELKNPPQVNDSSTQNYLERTTDRNQVSVSGKGAALAIGNKAIGNTASGDPTGNNPAKGCSGNSNTASGNSGGANSGGANFGSSNQSSGLSPVQQQFVLRFCRQLASVIAACEQSESAEIEVGRRHIDSSQIKVKLQAEREYSDKTN